MIIMPKPTMSVVMGMITICRAAPRIDLNLAPLRKLLECLRNHPAALAIIRYDAATKGDNAIMAQNTRKSHGDDVARLEIILICHR